MHKSLVIIDACVRQDDSRTLRIAEPVLEALCPRFDNVYRYNLPKMRGLAPITPKSFAERGAGKIPAWAVKAARRIASADAIVIAAPFWDMGIPAVLKCFLEQVSLFGITFDDNGKTCVGLCKGAPVLFITTRGMDIRTGSVREQASPYLKALASLWGLGKVTTIAAPNLDYSSPEEIEAKIQSAVREGLDTLPSLMA